MDPADEDAHQRSAEIGRAALQSYPVFGDAPTVSWAASSFNTIFHVTSRSGLEGALRVGPAERLHADGTELVEARWMRALRADAGVPTPHVHDAADGLPFAWVDLPAAGPPRVCMAFEWIDGEVLSGAMAPPAARRMGALMASMHGHAAGWGVPDPGPLPADRVLYWRVEDRLHGFRAADSLVGEAFDRASDAVAALWADPPHRPHLLHGDFTARNVMMRDRLLVPIDFQDLVVGFDVQDLAIALDSLGRFAGGTDLREEFRVGYESVRPWPDLDAGLLDALIAARLLHQLNLNLAVGLWETGLDRFIARVRGRLAEWMA